MILYVQNEFMNERGVDAQHYSPLPPLSVYENSTYGISIGYPSNWNVYTPINEPNKRNVFIVGFEVASIEGRVAPYFEIIRDVFDRNQTISTYVAEVIQSHRTQLPDFTLISTDLLFATLADNPAYSLLYTYTDKETGNIRLEKEIGTIISGTDMVYYVTYSADIPDYSLYESNVEYDFLPSLEIHIKGMNATAQPFKPDSDMENDRVMQELLNSKEL